MNGIIQWCDVITWFLCVCSVFLLPFLTILIFQGYQNFWSLLRGAQLCCSQTCIAFALNETDSILVEHDLHHISKIWIILFQLNALSTIHCGEFLWNFICVVFLRPISQTHSEPKLKRMWMPKKELLFIFTALELLHPG